MRHHSQRVPGKNYRLLAGKPMYQHILTTLLACPEIGQVVVDTDSPVVLSGLRENFPAVCVIERPIELRADTVPMKVLENQFRNYFCNMTREEDLEYILEQNFLPEPVCVLTHRVNWLNYPNINKTYILCTGDKTLTMEQQKSYAEHLEITDLRRIESDHMVMISHAQELADVLNEIGK
jgi:hypothetical protein